MTLLKPSEIFYSQDSINNVFDRRSLHSGRLIGKTLDDICEGRCSERSIPTISVVNRSGKWFTCDNRRLWVFRHLERLGKVAEIPVLVTSYIPSWKLTSVNGGTEITVRRNPGGHWYNQPNNNIEICEQTTESRKKSQKRQYGNNESIESMIESLSMEQKLQLMDRLIDRITRKERDRKTTRTILWELFFLLFPSERESQP